jgi:hypothetical protein
LFDFTFLRRKLTKFRYGGIFDSFIQSSFLRRKEGLGFYRRLVLFPRHGLGNGVPSLSFTGLVDSLSSTISLARENGMERIEYFALYTNHHMCTSSIITIVVASSRQVLFVRHHSFTCPSCVLWMNDILRSAHDKVQSRVKILNS